MDSRLLRASGLGCAFLLVTAAGTARAAPGGGGASPAPVESAKAEAKRHYDRGTALFALDRYDEAIKEFEEGYLASPLPAFLYNIGQAHKRAGRPDKARSYFERYLEMAPDAADRPQVEKLIAEIDAAKSRTPAPTTPPPAITPSASTPAAPVVVPAPPPAEAPPAASDKRPSRALLWGLVGGGAALVAAGVVVGVVLGTRPPSTDFGIVEPFQ